MPVASALMADTKFSIVFDEWVPLNEGKCFQNICKDVPYIQYFNLISLRIISCKPFNKIKHIYVEKADENDG